MQDNLSESTLASCTAFGSDFESGPVALGTMTFGDQVDPGTSRRMVEVAREAGVNFFDTANSYGNGESERILGDAVREFRDEVIIATKVGSRRIAEADKLRLSATAIRTAVDESLRRLGTDYIDLYYLHMPDNGVAVEETLSAMDELVRSGKVRAVGQSNYPAWQMAKMRGIAEREGYLPIRVSQIMSNMLARRSEGSYARCVEDLGIRTVAYNPLAGGLLTGKYFAYSATSGAVAGTRFERDLYRDRYWNSTQLEAVKLLTGVAARAGISLVELALRWVRHQPLIDVVLLGASSVEQLEENLVVMALPPLDRDVLTEVDDVWATLTGVAPRYWR